MLVVNDRELEKIIKRRKKIKPTAFEFKLKEFSEIMGHAKTPNQRVMQIINSNFEEIRVEILQEASVVKKYINYNHSLIGFPNFEKCCNRKIFKPL